MTDIPFPVDGQVLDVNGNAADGATVEVYNLRNGNKANGTTDANGVYIIDLQNFSDFTFVNNDPFLIRSHMWRDIFSFAELKVTVDLNAGSLENQDLTLKPESPAHAKTERSEIFEQKEHHPTANAKKTMLVDKDGFDIVDSSSHLQVDIAADSVGIGGGTQYTEGDVDATITGNVLLGESASDIVNPLQLDTNKYLKINPSAEYLLEVAKGNISGHKLVDKFGHNDAVGTDFEEIWDEGGTYSYPTSAGTMTLSSSDANDTSAGTGARTVQVEYLDGSYNEQTSDNMSLNGQTGVNIEKDSVNASILRVHRIKVITAGSGGENAGDIYVGTGTITAGVPANKYAKIAVGNNQTMMAIYTIPNAKTGYLLQTSLSTASAKETIIHFQARPLDETFQMKHEWHIYQTTHEHREDFFEKFDAKTDLKIKAKVDVGEAALTGNFYLVLVDD